MTTNESTATACTLPAILVPACVEDCLSDTEQSVELTALLGIPAGSLRIVANSDAVWSLVRGRFWLSQTQLVEELRRGVAELFEAVGPLPAMASLRVRVPSGTPQHRVTVYVNKHAAVPFIFIEG